MKEGLVSTNIRCSSGCTGLDDVLGGGLPAGHFYLIEGEPGTGKTTLGLQFISEGMKRGENVLYVTLSESRDELVSVATTHGLDVDPSVVLEVRPSEEDLTPDGQYTVFHPAEVELKDRVQTIMAEVDRRRPTRLVIDVLSEVRMLAKDPLRYRRQVLSLKGGFLEIESSPDGTLLKATIPVLQTDGIETEDGSVLLPSAGHAPAPAA